MSSATGPNTDPKNASLALVDEPDMHQPLTRDQLDTLISISDLLRNHLTPDELSQWFFMPNSALKGVAPVKALEAGETRAVRRAAKRLVRERVQAGDDQRPPLPLL